MDYFDFRISPSGENMLLRPLTSAGLNWAWDNLPKGERRMGPVAIVEKGRVTVTLTGILQAGLTIAPLGGKDQSK